MATHPKKIIDAHCHIGEIPPWKFYDLEHPVKPTVYDYADTKQFVKRHMDYFKVERALAISNYGVPIHELSFDLNEVVMDAATSNDRILAAIWVSFLPRNAELTRKALKLAGESRVVALKTTFLLGGNPDPGSWDEETTALADEIFDVCEQHDLMFHFHTSPGGNSDINNFIPLVEKYGKRCKIYLVHFGGGVSGHIKLVPKFLQWVRDGYKVYTDTSWAVGFGARWLLTEIEKQGVGGDRVFFGSDEPWSDFDSEYWKLNGVRDISQELKERVFWQNYEEVYGTHAVASTTVSCWSSCSRSGSAWSTRRPARCRGASAAPDRLTRCSCGCAGCRSRCPRTRATWPPRPTPCASRGGGRRCIATTS